MGTGNEFKSDLYSLFNYTQNTAITYGTSLLIEVLRDFFSQDSYYRYVRDEWGFAKTPEETGMPYDAGIKDDLTTRLFIGEYFRQTVQFYPAILVRNAGFRSVPISLSRNKYYTNWDEFLYVDGYGNSKYIRKPVSQELNGAWEGSFTIDVLSRSSMARNDLVDLIQIFFVDKEYENLKNAGLVIKNVSSSSPVESEDRNDKLFKQTITLDTRAEWTRTIPIDKTIEIINFCIEFGNTDKIPFVPATGLTIKTELNLLDELNAGLLEE